MSLLLVFAAGCGATDREDPQDTGADLETSVDLDTGDVSRDLVATDGVDADLVPDVVPDGSDLLEFPDDSRDAMTDMDVVADMDMSSMWGTCTAGGQPGICIDVATCDGGRVTTPNLCPGPANIRCCHERSMPNSCDEMDRVIPAAVLVEAPGVGGCPDGMVPVDGFCIDQYEAVVVEVLQDGSTIPVSPFFNPGTAQIRALSVRDAVPQGYITGTQAAAACNDAGKRLCTDTEWLRACQGSSGQTYPYGNTRQPGVCNDSRSPHPVVEYFGTGDSWIWSELGNPCISQQADTVDRTGANVGCVSDDDVYDMMGNLHEWTADPAGTFRGGFYVDTVINGNGCLYRTTAHSVGHWDYSTGFRCCF